jgi:hypothetical protein
MINYENGGGGTLPVGAITQKTGLGHGLGGGGGGGPNNN